MKIGVVKHADGSSTVYPGVDDEMASFVHSIFERRHPSVRRVQIEFKTVDGKLVKVETELA